MKKWIQFWILAVLLTVVSGCGYRLGNMTVGGIKTISLAVIENETGKSFIEESLVSNTLVREFNRDGSVKVVDKDLADATLKVRLTQYNQRAEVFSSIDVGEQFRLLIDSQISVVDNQTGKVLHTASIQGESDYDAQLDQSEIERTATQGAITDLSIDIVRSIVEGGW